MSIQRASLRDIVDDVEDEQHRVLRFPKKAKTVDADMVDHNNRETLDRKDVKCRKEVK